VTSFTYKNVDRLSIIDPNNPSNDISGGSSNMAVIKSAFWYAYKQMTDQLRALGESGRPGSILGEILAGDYSSFRQQRAYLRHVHEKYLGPVSE
jgi:non-canonical poly(A) RNA polymerase PAPD5/7